MQQHLAAWLVKQKFPYLPSRDRKNRLFQYGSPAVFEVLRNAGIVYQGTRHPESPSLERVSLPEGIRFVAHASNHRCALLLGSNNEQIAHAYFDNKLNNWILYTPQSGASPLNKGMDDALHETLEELATSVEKAGKAAASRVRKAANKVGGFLRTLDES
jgi:hypothetical protein